MLSNSIEFLLDDGYAYFDGYNNFFSGMKYKSAVRFHSEIVARTYAPRRVLP
jgi:hypothetical protein